MEFYIKIINYKSKYKDKFPEWFQEDCIKLPIESVSLEQSSSLLTAEIKSNLVNFDSAIDLTGGYGIDTYFLTKKAKNVIYIEPNQLLLNIVKENFDFLDIRNISYINNSAENFLTEYNQSVDLIYCDPSRRNSYKKVFNLEDSEPNVLKIIDKISNISKYFLLKTSPFLDISHTIKQFNRIAYIILISSNRELKEVLYLFDFTQETQIEYKIIIEQKNKIKEYNFSNKKTEINFSYPNKYIYEPDSSLMKLAFWSEYGSIYGIKKIAINSHLYTSEKLNPEFPGRVYEIIDIIKPDKKLLKTIIPNLQANLKIRNYPETVEKLKKKLSLKDGGDFYIFATQLIDKKYKLIVCKKADFLISL